jgi:hypothetical protein
MNKHDWIWITPDESRECPVRYRQTDPDPFGRKHELDVGYDGIYLTDPEAIAFIVASKLYHKLPEVRALVEAVTQMLYQVDNTYADDPDWTVGEWSYEEPTVGYLRKALAPFKDVPDAP